MSNFITLAQGVAMTTKYRDEKENILEAAYKGKGILPVCETFDKASFAALLAETDCTYIRVYLGMDDDLKVRVLAVAADSNNVDILPAAGTNKLKAVNDDGDDDGNIVEDGQRCPDICPPDSPLNP